MSKKAIEKINTEIQYWEYMKEVKPYIFTDKEIETIDFLIEDGQRIINEMNNGKRCWVSRACRAITNIGLIDKQR